MKLPTASELRKKMQHVSELLYNEWKSILIERLNKFELQGTISEVDYSTNVPIQFWNLPNKYLRSALKQVEIDLSEYNYDFEIKMEVIETENDEEKFLIHYSIELPEEEPEQQQEQNDSKSIKNLIDKMLSVEREEAGHRVICL